MGQWGSSGTLWGGGVAEAVYPAYHVILGGVGLVFGPGGYERRLGQQYAAKLNTGRTTQQARIAEQVFEWSSWEGGEGYLRHETGTPDRYRRGGGIDATSDVGAVGLGPYMSNPAALQTSQNELSAMIAYNGYLVIGAGDGKVYRWDGTTLGLAIDTSKAGGIRSFGIWEGALYAGNGTDGAVWRWVGSTLLTSFSSNFTVGAYSGGTVTGVYGFQPFFKDSTLSAIYGARSSNNALAGEIANTGGTTTAAASNGTLIAQEPWLTVLLVYQGELLAVAVRSTAQTWRLYKGDNSATTGWELVAEGSGGYPVSGCVFNDRVYFGDIKQGRIWRWDGRDLEVAYQLGSDAVPYTAEIKGMCVWRGALWVSIVHTDGTLGLLRYDGSNTWTRPVIGLTGTTPGVLCVWNDQLHMVTNATGAAKVWRTDGTFCASGSVESGLVNENLTGTDKLWIGVKVSHSALASGQSVEVQYRLEDAGSWVSLGTSDTDGATSAEFDFPSAITAEQIAFKLILTGTAGSSTQLKVYSLVGRYKPAPGAKAEWALTVRLEGDTRGSLTLADGTSETRTGEEISAEIWALVDAIAPVNFVDIDREEYTVRIEEYREGLSTIRPNVDPLDSGWNLQGTLRLTEV